jgi:hypothetical protein
MINVPGDKSADYSDFAVTHCVVPVSSHHSVPHESVPLLYVNKMVMVTRDYFRGNPSSFWNDCHVLLKNLFRFILNVINILIPVGERKEQGNGERWWIWWKYFIFMYENRTMKPVDIDLRREGGWEELWRGESNKDIL